MSNLPAVVLSGSGMSVPPFVIDNRELCTAYNAYVQIHNATHRDDIAAGKVTALLESDPDFIERASGIAQRYVCDKTGICDPQVMRPNMPQRPDDELCAQAELAVAACKQALQAAGRSGADVDMVLLASSNLQRPYPAVAMEVQHALGATGIAYDMNVACSSGTFAIQTACDAVKVGSAQCAIVVVPEIMSGHLNWRDRDSHFIFGDGCAAVIVEPEHRYRGARAWKVLATKAMAQYSQNIRNNGGYLGRCDPERRDEPDKLFVQQGRKVFKDIVPLASTFIQEHIESVGLDPGSMQRYWLHQANANMNRLIGQRIMGRECSRQEAPTILDRYANTAGAGALIAFHLYNEDLPVGAKAILCSFGAGYSIGNVILEAVSKSS